MNPRHPVYIVSKSRWDRCLTAKALTALKVPFRIVVEESQRPDYAAVWGTDRLLVLPQSYLDEYDTCDGEAEGVVKSKGPGAARNFCWDHAIRQGATWHWVMDDNIEHFYRLNRNLKVKMLTGAGLAAAEDFVERYENVAIAGLNYDKFCKATDAVPPYVLNTRIYSCLLIRNDIPYRWRGRYNEDTDLSLRALKDGWCTIQFNAFLAAKVTTQRMTGGNTDEFYAHEGTLAKSKLLAEMHPDVTKVVWKFSRWHHQVDYKPFRQNKLKRKEGLLIPQGVNEYGMVLRQTK